MYASAASSTVSVNDYYARPATMTSSGASAGALEGLPDDVTDLCKVVQGVLLHQHFAPAYGLTLSPEQIAQSQIRPVARMLAELLAGDSRPLTVARRSEGRLVGVCRHFTVLLCAMLRRKGVPARARCGFGAYFNAGRFEDHWVCEYWNDDEARWILVDAQIDDVQRGIVKPDFDLLDVPRDRFIIAGDAWRRCRGGADPNLFGIFDIRGLYFVAGNVLRDFAALNNMEMLPWDVWGAMLPAGVEPDAEALALFDRLSDLTLSVDERFDDLRSLYDGDAALRVPGSVFNIMRNAHEPVP